MTIQKILNEVSTYHCNLIEITGGEPLLQKDTPDLIQLLIQNDYSVLIETGGQDVLVIFLTDSQLAVIKENNLLPIVMPKESAAVEKGKEFEEKVIRQIEENTQ